MVTFGLLSYVPVWHWGPCFFTLLLSLCFIFHVLRECGRPPSELFILTISFFMSINFICIFSIFNFTLHCVYIWLYIFIMLIITALIIIPFSLWLPGPFLLADFSLGLWTPFPDSLHVYESSLDTRNCEHYFVKCLDFVFLFERVLCHGSQFFFFLLLFNYSCVPFLPIPPPHPI